MLLSLQERINSGHHEPAEGFEVMSTLEHQLCNSTMSTLLCADILQDYTTCKSCTSGDHPHSSQAASGVSR